MKDGEIVESGSHHDLLALKGEYATLYNIQSQAFSSEGGQSEVRSPPTFDSQGF